ncbi:MAG TPA: hypothetical protein GXZ32_05655 [Clostridiales bacterium]|nr:hypothetical protein [Clostridiales bacterium]
MLDKILQRVGDSKNTAGGDIVNKSNIIVNMVNITDVVDTSNLDMASSCIVIIAIEPFAFKDLSVEGLRRHVKITKDHRGDIYVNNSKVGFLDLGNGIKASIILGEESE